MNRYVVIVTLDGDYNHIENNINMIVQSIDSIGLRRVDIEIQNHGEFEE